VLSQDTIVQNQIDLDNNEYVTIYLSPEEQVQSEVNVTVQFFKNSSSMRIISFLNYLRTNTQANYLVSALNTNIVNYLSDYQNKLISYPAPTMFGVGDIDTTTGIGVDLCGQSNPIGAAGFFEISNYSHYVYHSYWSLPESNSTLVKGFYGGCTPLEAVLHSTLDCLYDIECLELLTDYFPDLNKVCMT